MTRRLLRALLLAAGLALLVYLFAQVGVRAAFEQARRVGWTFVLVFLLGGLAHYLRALTWVRLLRLDGGRKQFWRMQALWLAGEAVSHLAFSWTGEAYRVLAPRKHIASAHGVAAMTLNRALYSAAGLSIVVLGLVAAMGMTELPPAVRVNLGRVLMGVAIGGGAVYLLGRLGWRRWSRGPTSDAAPPQSRLGHFLHELRHSLASMTARSRSEFAYLMGLNLLSALIGVAEVWLVLRVLGVPVTLAMTLVVEGFLKLLSTLAYLVPGNIGVAESGFVLVLHALNVSGAPALALAMVRRARSLAWVGIGGLFLLVLRPERWFASEGSPGAGLQEREKVDAQLSR